MLEQVILQTNKGEASMQNPGYLADVILPIAEHRCTFILGTIIHDTRNLEMKKRSCFTAIT